MPRDFIRAQDIPTLETFLAELSPEDELLCRRALMGRFTSCRRTNWWTRVEQLEAQFASPADKARLEKRNAAVTKTIAEFLGTFGR